MTIQVPRKNLLDKLLGRKIEVPDLKEAERKYGRHVFMKARKQSWLKTLKTLFRKKQS